MTSLFDLTATQQKILTQNIAFFKGLNLPFAILFPDGEVIGDLKIANHEPKKTKKRKHKYEFGSVRKHLSTVMLDLPISKTVFLPVNEFDLDTLQSGAASWGHKKYGTGCIFTSQNKKTQQLEITRKF